MHFNVLFRNFRSHLPTKLPVLLVQKLFQRPFPSGEKFNNMNFIQVLLLRLRKIEIRVYYRYWVR